MCAHLKNNWGVIHDFDLFALRTYFGCCNILLEFGIQLFSLKNTILKINVSGEL